MYSNTAEDKNFNTLCIGKAIHTLTTPGLITRTYMPQTHWQTFILQTPLQLDDPQYKETTEIPKQSLILSLHWPSTLTTTVLLFNDFSKRSLVIPLPYSFKPIFLKPTPLNAYLPFPHLPCPAHPPPSLFLPILHLPLVALATPPTSSPPLLLTVPPVTK